MVVGELLAVLGNDIHDVELEVFFLQEQVLMLRVDVNELLADGFHDAEGHGGVVDEGAALAGGGELASEDAVLGVVVDVEGREKAFQLVAAEVEMGLDDAAVGARLDAPGIGSLA